MTLQEAATSDASHAIGPSYPQLLPALSGWFRGRGVPFEESKDLGQETIVRTLTHLKRHGQRGDDLKPLVFTIARNLLAERARRHTAHVIALNEHIDVADPAPTPLEQVVEGEQRTSVVEALGSLAPRHRRVIELWMAGDTPAEIASSLGIKRNAADALLHRARRRLAALLRETGTGAPSVLGLWRLRMRDATRRLAVAVGYFDPMTVVGQAVGVVAVFSIAGALGVAAPSAAHPDAHGVRAAAIVHDGSAAAGTSHALGRATASTTHHTGPSGVSADIADHRLSAHTSVKNPATGTSTPIGIDIWQQSGGHVGHTEEVVDTATRELCSVDCPNVGGG